MLSKAHFTITHEPAGFTIKDLDPKTHARERSGNYPHVLKLMTRCGLVSVHFSVCRGADTIAASSTRTSPNWSVWSETNDSPKK